MNDKKLKFDNKKTSLMLIELLKVFQNHKPTVGELLVAYGNLGFSLGASIGGYEGKGPSVEELKELYYKDPHRIDVALMLEGLTVTTWFESWEDLQIKRYEQENQEES